jgi:uncharacterized protein YjdB
MILYDKNGNELASSMAVGNQEEGSARVMVYELTYQVGPGNYYVQVFNSHSLLGSMYWNISYDVHAYLEDDESVSGVSLDQKSLTLTAGGNAVQLIATIEPPTAANKIVTWTSGDSNVATVDDNGHITPLSQGMAIITVTSNDGNKTASCSVYVNPAQNTLQSIAITTPASKLSYTVGNALDITGLVVTGTYRDGSTKAESITAANVTGFNSATVKTDQVLTVTVGTKTTTYKVQIVAAPAKAANGDFYDKVNNIPYNAVNYRADKTSFNALLSALDARAGDFIFRNGSHCYKYLGMLTDITNQMAIGKSATDAFIYAKADVANMDVATVALQITAIGTWNPILSSVKISVNDSSLVKNAYNGTTDLGAFIVNDATHVTVFCDEQPTALALAGTDGVKVFAPTPTIQ